MKKWFAIAALLFAFGAQAQNQSKPAQQRTPAKDEVSTGKLYGERFNEKDAISVTELSKKAKNSTVENVTVYGKITEVCQSEGCWMRVMREDGTPMLVKMKDHAFFLPKDVAGKDVVFHGKAYQTTVSVKMLQHYAEDAGKSKEEIAKITEPSTEVAFEASGVIVK